MPVVSIQRFCASRSAAAGAADCTITLPFPPARVDASCAACWAADTFWLVVTKLFCRPVMAWPCDVITPSASVTRVDRLLTTEASALVCATVSAFAAAAAASVATLSVTATQAVPLQRLGVFALPVVSIQRFCARRSATAGAAD
ncbi:hypothetical protein D3C76_1279360 [compost metagenome]